ncbi:phage major tail tube protein [Burkholderia alba]|uniref:phage major tail tube protein n=1 Tax=Burkholderia alba TaxID=2683677 RepID=UPI002B0555A8|nr:phage major tail tube protein [Burkholderia alba]
MVAKDVRKNLNLFVDGRGFAAEVEEVNAPKLTQKNEDFRGGGMNAPIEVTLGMEKLNADFTMVSYNKDVLALFGVTEGNTVPFILREALESFDGKVTAVVHTMRGKIKEIDPGASKPGDLPKLKVSLALHYYKLQHGDSVIHEIDVLNMTQIINGSDTLAAIRKAIGM